MLRIAEKEGYDIGALFLTGNRLLMRREGRLVEICRQDSVYWTVQMTDTLPAVCETIHVLKRAGWSGGSSSRG